VTCLEVRERLPEHALGLLARVDATEVERHLEFCPGCRKESAELEEGASRMALAIPTADPPNSLETRVVDRVRMAAGTLPTAPRRRGRLVTVTLVAALLAMGATGWAIAERREVQTLKEQVSEKQAQLAAFGKALESFQGRGTTYRANLAPAPGMGQGGGSAVIASAPGLEDFVFIDVLVPGARGPFRFQIVDDKSALKAVQLLKAGSGSWIRYWRTNKDLSGAVTITILDSQNHAILSGAVHPYAAEPVAQAD
jgi:hypothetical protein